MQIYFQGDETNIKTNICVFSIALLVVQTMFPVPASAWFLLSDITASPRKYVAGDILTQLVQTFSHQRKKLLTASILEGYLIKIRKNKNDDFVAQHIMYYYISFVFY